MASLIAINFYYAILTSAWHQTIEYDFEFDTKDFKDKNDMKIFESEYLSADFFQLLSSKRSNRFDLSDKTDSILIGAR